MFTTQAVSPEITKLAAALAACPIDGTITHAELSAVTSRDIVQCRYLVYAAMQIAQSESGAVFETVRKVGYRRLKPEEIPQIGKSVRTRIRRVARRGLSAMADAVRHANDIPDNVRQEIYREQSQIGLLQHMAGRLPKEVLDRSPPHETAATIARVVDHLRNRGE